MDRVCQFYLRGRCNRNNCEFKHVKPAENADSASIYRKTPCRFFEANGSCRFGDHCRFFHDATSTQSGNVSQKIPPIVDSDEDLARGVDTDDDDESIVSGFTDYASLVAKKTKRGEKVEESAKSASAAATQSAKEDKTEEPKVKDKSPSIKASKTTSIQDPPPEKYSQKEDKKALPTAKKSINKNLVENQPETRLHPLEVNSQTDILKRTPLMVARKSVPKACDVNEVVEKEDTMKDASTVVQNMTKNKSLESSEIIDKSQNEGENQNKEVGTEKCAGDMPSSKMKKDKKVISGIKEKLDELVETKIHSKTTDMCSIKPKNDASLLELKRNEGVNYEMRRQARIRPDKTQRNRNSQSRLNYREIKSLINEDDDEEEEEEEEEEESSDWNSSTEDSPSDEKSDSSNHLKTKVRKRKIIRNQVTPAKSNNLKASDNLTQCNLCKYKRSKRSAKTGCTHLSKTRSVKPASVKKVRKSFKVNALQTISEDVATEKQQPQVQQQTSPSKPRKSNLPQDLQLPKFDPDKFKPGYKPPIIKKGDQEYAVVVTGVKDTGLCGTYWGDFDNSTSRRRTKRVSNDSTPLANSPKRTKLSPKKDAQVFKTQTKSNANDARAASKKKLTENLSPKKKIVEESSAIAPIKSKEIGSQRPKSPSKSKSPSKTPFAFPHIPSKSISGTASTPRAKNMEFEGDKIMARSASNDSFSSASASTVMPLDKERFAPYDDNRWANIGKDLFNTSLDAVQYTRALRLPYHLLSFLRIKGNSIKGISCTDKNNMVFVVIEGEVLVAVESRSSHFEARKGDSFYIPPKSNYNLINNKAREAELCIFQFANEGLFPATSASSDEKSSKPSK